MLNFISKLGKKVMELKDDGVIHIEDLRLKKELALQEGVKEKKEEAAKEEEK